MNEFYQAIEQRKDLKGNIKIIGIAIGNTPADVQYFKEKYKVPFPLFPDEEKSIYTALVSRRLHISLVSRPVRTEVLRSFIPN